MVLLGSYVKFIDDQCSADDLQEVVEVSHTPLTKASIYKFNYSVYILLAL